jgi:hypothetical protein
MGRSPQTMNAITLLTVLALAAVFALWARWEAAEWPRPALKRVRVERSGRRDER